ncbi:MAG: 2OG-Fe dioxygenase family protein [Xenococcaceae cyanobacterium]
MKTLLPKTDLDSEFMFTFLKVKSINLEGFNNFFEDLPVDPYLKRNYRFRRVSRFIVSGDELIKLPHGHFLQTKDYNHSLGGIKREFADIDDAIIAQDDFKKIIFAFSKICQLNPEADIAVHQARITCSMNNFGKPTPEGMHRDGADFVGIFSIARNNIQGGETHLYTPKKDKTVFRKVLNPGEFLLVNDHKFLHFTTPIKPISDDQVGNRDVFVMHSPSLIY